MVEDDTCNNLKHLCIQTAVVLHCTPDRAVTITVARNF
jgi:hypothetical protein